MDETLASALDKVLILSGRDPARGMFPRLVETLTDLTEVDVAAEALNERWVFVLIQSPSTLTNHTKIRYPHGLE